MASTGKLTVTADHDLTNGGSISAGGGADIRLGGALTNSNKLISGAGTYLQATAWQNSGTASVNGALSGNLTSLTNPGTLVVGGGLSLTGLSTMTNSGLIVANGTMAFEVAGAFVNSRGALTAAGDLSITGLSNGMAASILNDQGSIQSINGSILMQANAITNQATASLTPYSTTVLYVNYSGNHSVGLGSCPLGEGCKGQYWNSWSYVPSPFDPTRGGWYGSSNNLSARSFVVETGYTISGTPATISAGKNLTMAAGSITNSYSNILSAGDMSLTGTSLANTGADIHRNWYVTQMVDGQPVLVPQLYLADSSRLDSRSAAISSGGKTSLQANGLVNDGGAVAAGTDLSVTAQQSVVNVGGLISAVGAATGPVILGQNGGLVAGGVLTAASGAIGSKLTGGSAETGAITAEMGYFYNDVIHVELEGHMPSFIQKYMCGSFGACSPSYSIGGAVSYPGYTDALFDVAITSSKGGDGGVDISSATRPTTAGGWVKSLFDVSFGKNYGDFNIFSGVSNSVGGNFLIVGSGEMFTQNGTPYGSYVKIGEVGIGASTSISSTCVRSLRMSSGC